MKSTIRLDSTPGTYAFFVIPDLSLDLRYSGMKIVNEPPYFRFYAGMVEDFAGNSIG
jgi:hypothetical protein